MSCRPDRPAPAASPPSRPCPALSSSVGDTLARGALSLVMGGDHSLSLGTIDAVARHWARRGRALFVLWLDAHADYNTLETSPPGNLHGMPLAALCGEPGFEAVFGRGKRAVLAPANARLFGLRSIDPGERALVAERRIGGRAAGFAS